MTTPGRFALFLLSLLTLVAGGLTTGASQASATTTTLCKGYAACARLGMSDGGYAASSRTMWWRMYTGHNCTNYAAYRMVRNGMANSRPWSGSGNATNWGSAMSSLVDGTPRVGSVAWWRAGVRPAGRSGHVAYVEQVISPDEIIVSQDYWGGDFSWARITRTGTGWPSGFIHFNDVPLLSTAAPGLTGTPRTGQTLTASTGGWSAPGATFAYQWLQNGRVIRGATAPALTLGQGHQGATVSVRVTATLLGYAPATAASAATAPVQPGVLSSTAGPTISGEARVDATLTAEPGTWDPQPDEVRVQWNADGAPVAGATGATLTLSPELVDRTITVTTTALKAGYAPVGVTSPPTGPVAPGTMALAAPATVSGPAAPGEALAVDLSGVPAAATVSVQWLRAGVPVRGARGTTYRVSPADVGARLSARVRVTRPGYSPLVTRTNHTPFVRVTPTVTITAEPGPGRLAVTGTVTAPGVPRPDGTIQVRVRGVLLGEVPVRAGVVRGTLTGLEPGRRTFRFRLLQTGTVTAGVVQQRLTIG